MGLQSGDFLKASVFLSVKWPAWYSLPRVIEKFGCFREQNPHSRWEASNARPEWQSPQQGQPPWNDDPSFPLKWDHLPPAVPGGSPGCGPEQDCLAQCPRELSQLVLIPTVGTPARIAWPSCGQHERWPKGTVGHTLAEGRTQAPRGCPCSSPWNGDLATFCGVCRWGSGLGLT